MEQNTILYSSLRQVFAAADIPHSWWGDYPEPLNLLGTMFEDSLDLEGIADFFFKVAHTLAPEGVKYVVEFNKNSSYCAYGCSCVVSVAMDSYNLSLPLSDKNSIFFGRFIHELGHLRYTYPEMMKLLDLPLNSSNDEMTKKSKWKSSRLSRLVNIFEDRRIEEKLSFEFPGYHKYLYAARNGALADGYYIEANAPAKAMSPAASLMRYITSRVLYPSKVFVTASDKKALEEAQKESKFKEIDALLDARPASFPGIVSLATTINDLFDEEDKLQASFAKMPGSDPSDRLKSTEGLSKTATETIKSVKAKIFSKISDEEPFTERMSASQIEKVIQDQQDKETSLAKKETAKFKAPSCRNSTAEKRYAVPQRMTFPRQLNSYDEQASKEIERNLRREFKAYSTVMNRERLAYEQEEGDLDEDDLYMARFNRNIFTDDITEHSGGNLLEIVLLIDASGSMYGSSEHLARTLGVGLGEAFSRNPSVLLSAYAHTANNGNGGLTIYTIKDKKHRYEKEAFLSITSKQNNADGFAISWAAKQFDRRSKSRLLIVISDGQPYASNYSGAAANDHTRESVRAAKRAGIKVVSLAVKSYYQEECYDKEDIIPYESPQQVSTALCKWIHKNFASKMSLQSL